MKTSLVVVLIAFAIYAFDKWGDIKTENVEDVRSVKNLPKNLKNWLKLGQFSEIDGRSIFYIHKKCTNKEIKNPPVFVIIHGFPSSSFEYHKILNKLLQHGDVFMHDHLGFGFSDGPGGDYTYSMAQAADNALAIWRHAGIKQAHVISHDMGDSILAEILARHSRDLLPAHFKTFFQSVTFTNGGMKIRLANLRVSQLICLRSEKLCKLFQHLFSKMGLIEYVGQKQLSSVWSPTADIDTKKEDVSNLLDLNIYTNKNTLFPKTIYYLWDRFHFEDRYYKYFPTLGIPLRFVWGDSDSVAPLAIPLSFKDILPNMELTVVKDAGHFWMLEQPNTWVNEMIKVIQ